MELRCSYFPDSRSGSDTSGLKPKGVIHWVSAEDGKPAEVRVYDRLFQTPNPGAASLADDLNPESLVLRQAVVEPAVMASDERRFQFERLGYFCKDDERPDAFNRTVTLRDSWRPPA